ncbi:hypothetical protein HQ535_03365 [bacterium]|nr:hypothetical protein [bacterium]
MIHFLIAVLLTGSVLTPSDADRASDLCRGRAITIPAVALGEGSDQLAAFEGVLGSRYDDVINGGGEAGNTLRGNGGDDDISGQRGDDILVGGPGSDTLR